MKNFKNQNKIKSQYKFKYLRKNLSKVMNKHLYLKNHTKIRSLSIAVVKNNKMFKNKVNHKKIFIIKILKNQKIINKRY